MSDIKTGFTWSDDKANWANNNATALRLNQMMDDATINNGVTTIDFLK